MRTYFAIAVLLVSSVASAQPYYGSSSNYNNHNYYSQRAETMKYQNELRAIQSRVDRDISRQRANQSIENARRLVQPKAPYYPR